MNRPQPSTGTSLWDVRVAFFVTGFLLVLAGGLPLTI